MLRTATDPPTEIDPPTPTELNTRVTLDTGSKLVISNDPLISVAPLTNKRLSMVTFPKTLKVDSVTTIPGADKFPIIKGLLMTMAFVVKRFPMVKELAILEAELMNDAKRVLTPKESTLAAAVAGA